jgi:hypothetical protein
MFECECGNRTANVVIDFKSRRQHCGCKPFSAAWLARVSPPEPRTVGNVVYANFGPRPAPKTAA